MKTSLYKHYNESGEFLYVGISKDFLKRNFQHEHKSQWFYETSRIEIIHFNTRAEALAEEARIITDEKPIHNKQYNRPDDLIETACEVVLALNKVPRSDRDEVMQIVLDFRDGK